MQLDAVLWFFLPVVVAAGSALLSFYVMQARMEVALAKERESLAEARAMISSQKITMEERIKATQEATRRATLDELMQEFRLEERSYVRDVTGAGASKKLMVMQERMFFRNIPLSNWAEHEMVVEEGSGAQAPQVQVAHTQAIPEAQAPVAHPLTSPVTIPAASPVTSMIRMPPAPPEPKPQVKTPPRALVAMHAAFGAQ